MSGPKWHIAFCNVTFTDYAGVRYADYYGSPAVMLETQLAAKEYAERRYGVGRFMYPFVDSPACLFGSYLGVPVIEPVEDELAYLDTSRPVVDDVSQYGRVRIGDPRTEGLMGRRWSYWQYYKEHGYETRFGGYGGGVVTIACEISGGAALAGLGENPEDAARLLDVVVEAEETIARFDASVAGDEYLGMSYTGDDFSGLLSPAMYRRFAVPRYQRLYADREGRFMHSELLNAEHLMIARDEVGITEFHGAGCVNVSLQDMHRIMGSGFWTQLIPQEMDELTPAQIRDRVAELAQSGCSHVQLYPGRGVPEANMEAAIEAVQKECSGGPAW